MRVEIPIPASPQRLLTCSQRLGLVDRDRLYLAFAANGAGGTCCGCGEIVDTHRRCRTQAAAGDHGWLNTGMPEHDCRA